MSKLERLLNLTAALLETERPLTAEQLRDRVPGYPEAKASFRRTFERDKDEIRRLGLPLTVTRIDADRGPVDAYRIPSDEYEFVALDLEPDELTAVALAARSLQLGGSASSSALWKLGGAGADADALAVGDLVGEPALAVVFEAITVKRSVTFIYRGRERHIDPGRLDFRRGRWYLTGFDHDVDELRTFRLDRIEGDAAMGGPSTLEGPIDRELTLEPWQLGDEQPVVAQLLLDHSISTWTMRTVSGLTAVADTATGLLVECEVRSQQAFCSFVAGLLAEAEIVGPPELRSAMTDWLSQMASP